METIILVIHLLLAIALVAVILLQRSEGGALGIGGGGGVMTGRGAANLLTRTTAILATGFMATSIILAILAGNTGEPVSILDSAPDAAAPAQAPAAPAAPAEPSGPSVPVTE